MKRKLFCQLSPLAYKISVFKCQTVRRFKNLFSFGKTARQRQTEKLPFLICSHKSLIRRTLGNVNPQLQSNKAVNLAIAAPKVTGIIIKPQEEFSFWAAAGKCTVKKGYKEGLTISAGQPSTGIGGGMCQFTNLIHWLVLHTPLKITEHHHHDNIDMFPDFGRQVPFGVGTSIMFNYLDYRFKNKTDYTFQLITWVDDQYLCGEIRADKALSVKYHIKKENECFVKENGMVYRCGEIYRHCVDVRTGNLIKKELIKSNHARVMYDTSHLAVEDKAHNKSSPA